eukprot:672336-Pyramimonas_sp.AAC.1
MDPPSHFYHPMVFSFPRGGAMALCVVLRTYTVPPPRRTTHRLAGIRLFLHRQSHRFTLPALAVKSGTDENKCTGFDD